MKITKKTGLIAAGIFVGATALAAAVRAYFLTVTLCCPADQGPCWEISSASECKAPDLVTSCGCPSTNPNGGVDCGC